MIKHIFIIIWNQRKSNGWLIAELFLASVCLWFVVDYMGALWTIVHKPLGFNAEYTYRIDLSERTPEAEGYMAPDVKETTSGEDLLMIMERIRQYPAIEAVSLSMSAQPYTATGYSSLTRFQKLYYADSVSITAQEYKVSPSFFDVFQNKPTREANEALKRALQPQTIILSEDAEKKLMQGESSEDKIIKVGKEGQLTTVKAVCSPVRWTEYFKSNPCFYTLLPEADIAANVTADNLSSYELCVRVKPEMVSDFESNFTTDMAQQLLTGNMYLMELRPSSVIRRAVVIPEESVLQTRSVLFFFILINIFLGVSGTFLFRTQYRLKEMGLRVALGSTKRSLKTLLIMEGLLILSMATIPAIIVNFNLGVSELVTLQWMDFTPVRYITGILVTYIIIAGMVIVGIWYPASRVAKIEVTETLHAE